MQLNLSINVFLFFVSLFRLLMRREQIFKICLNHALTPDITFKPKDDKSWLWAAQDFAEGEGKAETFVIRFRDAEISKGFMKAIQENKVNRFYSSL